MRTSLTNRVIHWFSPLPPAPTDIAGYTQRILPDLAKQARVILWTDQDQWDHALEAHATIARFDADHFTPRDIMKARQNLNVPPHASDTLFIHIGNNWEFHSRLMKLALKLPSVIVLHDLVIQELLVDSAIYGIMEHDWYLKTIETYFGHDSVETARRVLNGDRQAILSLLHLSGGEVFSKTALGILQHGQRVQFTQDLGIPNFHLELPFAFADNVTPQNLKSGPIRIFQFGHIGPNRRAYETLETLSELKDQVAFRFDIAGTFWDGKGLDKKISECGLQEHVHRHGYVTETRLNEMISQAHIVLNLRFPTMGEASGSQLRIWSQASCAVVSDHGWYASLPDNTVLKIPFQAEAERDALKEIIRNLEVNRLCYQSVGEAGFARLKAKHAPQLYTGEIAQICDQITDLSRGYTMG